MGFAELLAEGDQHAAFLALPLDYSEGYTVASSDPGTPGGVMMFGRIGHVLVIYSQSVCDHGQLDTRTNIRTMDSEESVTAAIASCVEKLKKEVSMSALVARLTGAPALSLAML